MTAPQVSARQAPSGPALRRFGDRYVVAADRVFDGTRVLAGHAVAVSDDKITAVAPAGRLSGPGNASGSRARCFLVSSNCMLTCGSGRSRRTWCYATGSPPSGRPAGHWRRPRAATGGCGCWLPGRSSPRQGAIRSRCSALPPHLKWLTFRQPAKQSAWCCWRRRVHQDRLGARRITRGAVDQRAPARMPAAVADHVT